MKKIILAALSIVLFSCSSDSPTAAAPVVSTDVAYFRAKLNGVPLDYTQNSSIDRAYNNSIGTGYITSGIDFDFSICYFSDMVPSGGADYPKIRIEYDNMYVTNDPDTETAAFFGLFNPAPTNFITETQADNWEKGVQVTYYKADGTYYSTLVGDQTGSNIAITNKTELTVSGLEGRNKSVILKGTVNCKLYNYNEPSADPIILTNGKFKLQFTEYID